MEVSHVKTVLQNYSQRLSVSDLHQMIRAIRIAADQDEQLMNTKISDLKECLSTDITARDQRDSRLQYLMTTNNNIPVDEHMAQFRRSCDNLNSLYSETYGNPGAYEEGRKLVEKTARFQGLNLRTNSKG